VLRPVAASRRGGCLGKVLLTAYPIDGELPVGAVPQRNTRLRKLGERCSYPPSGETTDDATGVAASATKRPSGCRTYCAERDRTRAVPKRPPASRVIPSVQKRESAPAKIVNAGPTWRHASWHALRLSRCPSAQVDQVIKSGRLAAANSLRGTTRVLPRPWTNENPAAH